MKTVDYIQKNGVVFTSWYGAAHPSGPNYRALMSGNTWSGNEFDGVQRENIGDHVNVVVNNYKGIPADRHNPFKDMQSSHLKTQLMVTDGSIWYLGMDDQNNGHSASLDIADQNVYDALQQLPHWTMPNWLALVVFDEAYGVDWLSNHVFAGMIGPAIKIARQVHSPIRHENFARFIYDNWSIAPPQEYPTGLYAGKCLYELD
jgi:hypothetical protein